MSGASLYLSERHPVEMSAPGGLYHNPGQTRDGEQEFVKQDSQFVLSEEFFKLLFSWTLKNNTFGLENKSFTINETDH